MLFKITSLALTKYGTADDSIILKLLDITHLAANISNLSNRVNTKQVKLMPSMFLPGSSDAFSQPLLRITPI